VNQGFPRQPDLVTRSDRRDERGRRKGCEKMKYARVAAIVAGSVVAMGAAAPAVAAGTTPMPPMSLNGGLVDGLETVRSTPAADLSSPRSAVTSVAETAMDLNNVKGDVPQHALKTATQLTPMPKGVEVGG
jgi:hypothetical protein